MDKVHSIKDPNGLRIRELMAKGLVSVDGRVKNPGVHLAPAGITIQELIDDFLQEACWMGEFI